MSHFLLFSFTLFLLPNVSYGSLNASACECHRLPELRLDQLGVGNKPINLDLNREADQLMLTQVVKTSFAALELGTTSTDFLQQIKPVSVPEKATGFMKVFNAAGPAIRAIGAMVSLLLPEETVELLKELKSVMIDEFTKLNVRFDQMDFKMDFRDFRDNVAEKMGTGMFILTKLWRMHSNNNLQAFKEWCRSSPPNNLAEKYRDRLGGAASILDSLHASMSGDEKTYLKIEHWLQKVLKSLTILSSSCEQIYPTAPENTIKEEFEEILKSILSKISHSKHRFLENWHISARKLAKQIIDEHPWNNDAIVEKLFRSLKSNYIGSFYVAVYDYDYGYGFSDTCDKSLAIGEIHDSPRRKAYWIARSSCKTSAVLGYPPDDVVYRATTPYKCMNGRSGRCSDSQLPKALHHYKREYCATSSMIGVVVREYSGEPFEWAYTYYRFVSDACAVQQRVLRRSNAVSEVVIVSL